MFINLVKHICVDLRSEINLFCDEFCLGQLLAYHIDCLESLWCWNSLTECWYCGNLLNVLWSLIFVFTFHCLNFSLQIKQKNVQYLLILLQYISLSSLLFLNLKPENLKISSVVVFTCVFTTSQIYTVWIYM